MASLVEGIVAYLVAQESVSSVVGQSIQPIPGPQERELFPVIVYQVVSDKNGRTLTGPDGVANARILFSCKMWKAPGSYLAARNLGLALHNALDGYQGTLPGGPQVFYAEAENPVDVYQEDGLLSVANVTAFITYQN